MKIAILIHIAVVMTIACVALLPMFSVMIAGTIAERNQCDLDEGSIHPCVVNGRDIGKDLYTMAMMGWLMIATIPLGAAAIFGYIVIVVLFYLVRMIVRRRRAAAAVE